MSSVLSTELTMKDAGFAQGIEQAKRKLDKFQIMSNNANQVLGKFGLSTQSAIGLLTKFTGVASLGAGALKVLKDSFFASESNIDEWGRTVEASKAAYSIFTNTINNGDWSGFFTRLNEAIGGAKQLYNLFDALGSTKLNNEVPIAILENQIAELRLLKQQGQDVSKALKAAEEELFKLKNEEVVLGKDANAQKWYDIVFKAGGSEMTIKAYWEEYQKKGEKFYAWAKAELADYQKKIAKTDYNYDDMGNITSKYTTYDIEKLNAVEQKRYKTLAAIVEKESELQIYQTGYANAVRQETANKTQEFKINRWGDKTSGGSGGSKIKVDVEPKIEQFNFSKLNGDLYKWGQEWAKQVNNGMTAYLKVNAKPIETIEDTANKGLKSIDDEYKNSLAKAAQAIAQKSQDTEAAWSGITSLIQTAGGAMQSLGDEGIQVAGIVAQAIATVALAYAQTLAKDKTSKSNIWSFIAAAAGATISMATTIASIHKSTGYANGGIIGGNSPYGDKLIARVNSGEMILNSGQQANLWHMINHPSNNTNSITGGKVEFEIKGQKLVGVQRNYYKKQSRL